VPAPIVQGGALAAREPLVSHVEVPPDLPREVAAEAGISLRYLQKLFMQRGSTCSGFIDSLRLDHAARLLRRRALTGTRQPISEIAYASGFSDCVRRFR